jgi:hypothetical protein
MECYINPRVSLPEHIQFGLLEMKVGQKVAQRVMDHTTKRYSELSVVGKDEQISCFGWTRADGGYLHLASNPNNGDIINEDYSEGAFESRESNMPLWLGVPLYTLSVLGIPFLPSYLMDQLNPSRRAQRAKRNELYDLQDRLQEKNFDEVKRLIESVTNIERPIKEMIEKQGLSLELASDLVDFNKDCSVVRSSYYQDPDETFNILFD